ncbi:hypothetical protein JFL43_04845 [Viridibacillus sp. YIM B01967]|uniref:Uncharacterized protein n=2 Tax=Viridibacillus soli TaxID=2798301 RepID=A0ABS1H453_9BACL|nr:hypothetical protein [Viridibacillus soli]MBK3494194.1 hypothetical protein [Viridibacillus soli]
MFKHFLSFALLVLFISTLAVPASAADTITGNNSSNTAYIIGNWKYSSTGTTILPEGENEAYYKFTANAGERVYVRSSYQHQYAGMKIEVYKNSLSVNTGTNVIDPSSLTPFIYAKADDVSSASETFYVKVSRGTYTGNMYFTVSILDRIKSGSGKFNFKETAINNGNTSLNLDGVDSSVITMDLTTNATIPLHAVVKSITTSSTQTPIQGNVTHKLISNQNGIWNTAIVSNPTSGSYNISLQNKLDVASIWSFKYNAKATAKSTMTNVNANINYEYDVTDQF